MSLFLVDVSLGGIAATYAKAAVLLASSLGAIFASSVMSRYPRIHSQAPPVSSEDTPSTRLETPAT